MHVTRREAVSAAASAAALGLAGCLGRSPTESRIETTETTEPREATETTAADAALPTAERPLHMAHDVGTLRNNVVSGGVSKDGIPSIDDPQFAAAADADLDDGDPVFGVERNGESKAYPQYVLVWHEIVNDAVGGEPVAVTYCPLTGTAQGFERGDAEFGVSGRLLNSNLVMYDRVTDSRWPQMLATAIDGQLEGRTLREFPVVWTTWRNWREAHPETRVLTDDTGYARRYGSDPYGNYNPRGGYYASDSTMFASLVEDDRAHPKDVVIGTRTAEGALAFGKTALLDARVLSGMLADMEYVAVADAGLGTGYVHENPDGLDLTPDGTEYQINGESYTAETLPLERSLAFDAMWFAWAGFYPDTTYVD